MRILHTADLHLRHKHKYTKLVEGKIWDKMFEEKMNVLRKLPSIADKYKANIVVFAGDIFDTTNPPEAIKAEFAKMVNSFNVPVWIIPGNHETGTFGNNALMDLGHAWENADDICLAPEGRVSNSLVGCFHLMMEGVDERYRGAVPYSDERFKDFRTILLGDYHSYFSRSYGNRNFIYSGPPYPTRLGEGNCSVNLIDVNPQNGALLDVKRLKIKSYEFVERELEFDPKKKVVKRPEINSIPDGVKWIVKDKVRCSMEHYNFLNNLMMTLKEIALNNAQILDYVYHISTEKEGSESVATGGRTINDVAMEYIKTNSPLPEEALGLYQDVFAEVSK